MYRLINGVLFYVVWFLLLQGATQGDTTWGLLAAAGALAVHLLISDNLVHELKVIGLTCVCGFALDTLYLQLGAIEYMAPNLWIPGTAPFWVVGIHILFGTSINLSLFFLVKRPALAAIAGAAAAPWSYLVAGHLGAIEIFWWPPYILGLIGVIWALYTPLVIYLAQRVKQ
jgi:hypothetical protein